MSRPLVRRILVTVKRSKRLFKTDSLFRNATYFMASTAIMSVLGFFFWIFVAHLYAPDQIGTASALIAITTLISNLSLLGLNSGLIRFLSGSKDRSRDINAAMLLVALVTLLAATFYVVVGVHLGGQISLLASSWHKLAFVFLMLAVSLNSLTDAVFISSRRGEYHTIGYATFGAVKLVLPLLLVPFGAAGIFGAYILAMIASLAVSLYLMWRGCGYQPLARPDWGLLGRMRSYTTHNYLGVVIAGLPSQLLPLLIIRKLGAAEVAFFSMAWTMANLLYIIPSSVTQSLLAESSHSPGQRVQHMRQAVRIMALLLVPSVVIAVAVAPYLLSIFGPAYRQNGTSIFQILALATFFIAISSVRNTVLNLQRRTWGIIVVQLTTLIVTGVSAVYLVRFGLTGVGVSLLLGNVAAVVVHAWLYRRFRLHDKPLREHRHGPTKVVLRRFMPMYGMAGATIGMDLGGGNQGATVVVRHRSRKYVLKVVSAHKHSIAELEGIYGFMQSLRETGIPVPHIIATKRGKFVARVGRGSGTWLGVLMNFEYGQHPKQYGQDLVAHMAQTQARIHTTGLAYAARHRKIAAMLRGTSFRSKLLVNTPKGFSHFDFDNQNVMVKGQQLSCVLDFEGARYDHLVICICFALFDLFNRERRATKIELYLSSYQEVRPLSFWERMVVRVALAVNFRRPSLLLLNF